MPDSIGYPNLLSRAQEILGQHMVVAQPKRTVTTKTNGENLC